MHESPVEIVSAIRRDLASLPHLNAQSVRRVGASHSKAFESQSPKTLYRTVCSLLENGTWAHRVIAWELLASRRDAFKLLSDKEVEKMARGLNDWGSVDLFGVTVLGQAWREGLVSDHKIHSWAKSNDRWRRRLALVATVPLNLKSRGGKGDWDRTLQVCTMLLDDRDDMVVKAMSWALRELAKREPQIIAEFVDLHADRLAARVKREVNTKLRTGRKT